MDEWIHGRTDGWTDGGMDGRVCKTTSPTTTNHPTAHPPTQPAHQARTDVLKVGGEPLVQPQLVPVPERHQVAKPHVGDLVGDDGGG